MSDSYQLEHLLDTYYNESVYHYLVALQGDVHASLPENVSKLNKSNFTLKTSGVAYFSNRPTELDVGGLTTLELREMKDYLLLLEEHDQAYNYVAASNGEPDNIDYLEPFRPCDVLVTAAGNVVVALYGPVQALPYSSAECGMSLDCLAALEDDFNNLAWSQDCYEHDVMVRALDKALPVQHIIQPLSQELVEELTNLVAQSTELQPTLHDRPNSQEFVAKLEAVDISEIAADDMVCLHCWSNFGEADGDMIELRVGEIQADHTPVKMPCPAGHLICKTCLMQLVDADIRLCPKCRVDIVSLVDF
ncbi:hypothetical protein OPT61_g5532 [Boeremia exigua]|uniref:Uncharacterized protein n=1 Tax=Boeremia exigua TaxID=749465 RepID=A0ACC2IA11_9PLEO|nr:hypothetical protein OPT61_g5532 [Boeremia exigua]